MLELYIHPNYKSRKDESRILFETARSQKITLHVPFHRKLLVDELQQNKAEIKKDENVRYRKQECQQRRDVKGVSGP
jgi:hypothetical protein